MLWVSGPCLAYFGGGGGGFISSWERFEFFVNFREGYCTVERLFVNNI